MRRSLLWFATTAAVGTNSTTASQLRTTPTTRGREELAMMRATVQVTEPAKEENMESFRDNRPRPSGETNDTLRRRLVYQSRYRGMVELDIICGSFAQARLSTLSDTALIEYDTLLRQYDNDLFNWLVSGKAPPADIAALGAWTELKQFVDANHEELLGHRL